MQQSICHNYRSDGCTSPEVWGIFQNFLSSVRKNCDNGHILVPSGNEHVKEERVEGEEVIQMCALMTEKYKVEGKP